MKIETVIEVEGVVQWEMNSILGALYLVASSRALRGVYWKRQDVPRSRSLQEQEGEHGGLILRLAVRQLGEYLAGERREFDIPLHPEGTAFQLRVWRQLRQIPYGETRTYGEIARGLKNENAVRAIGAANAKNPLPIIIPCHRVIGAGGALTGFSGGLEKKAKLLDLEKMAVK